MSGRGGGRKRGERERGRKGGREEKNNSKCTVYWRERGGRDREREGALEWRELREKCVGEKRVHNLIIFH